MKRYLYLSLFFFLIIFSAFSFAEQDKFVIIKNDISQEVNSQKILLYEGEIYPLLGIMTGENKSYVYYKISLSDDSDILIDPLNAKIINEDVDNKKLEEIRSKYFNKIKSYSLIKLENVYENVKSNLENWDYNSPYEYEIVKIISILQANHLGKGEFKKRVALYDNARQFIVDLFARIKIDKASYSIILCQLLETNPSFILTNNEDDFKLAIQAFETFPSNKSASCLLNRLWMHSNEVHKDLIDRILINVDLNSTSYSTLGNYYYYLKDKEKALVYYEIAEEKARNESTKENSLFYYSGKPILAEIYSNNSDYVKAAKEYLELEARTGRYAFQAAYYADKVLENGDKIPEVDKYKIIELYKKSNDPHGYYNSGLIYISMKSPRNVRLMAGILKNKYKDLEDANTLLDAADKLDAELKGHNPW